MRKKMAIWMIILNFALMSGTAFASQYIIDGQNPLALQINTGECGTVTIAIDSFGITTDLTQAGFWLVFNPMQVLVNDVDVYDGSITPAVWDPGLTGIVPDPSGSGTYMVTMGNFATVPANGAEILLADVEFCCEGPGQSQITISTIPEFDTVIGDDQTVWDSQVANGLIDLTQYEPPCWCELDGPSIVGRSAYHTVTEQYTASPGPYCTNPSVYLWSDDCVLADVDQAGLLTIPPTVMDEDCILTVVDNANTNIYTGGPVQCELPISLLGG